MGRACLRVSSEDEPPVQAVIDAGVVPVLVDFLRAPDTSTKLLVRCLPLLLWLCPAHLGA